MPFGYKICLLFSKIDIWKVLKSCKMASIRLIFLELTILFIFFGHTSRHVGSSLTEIREGRDQPIPSAVEVHT